MYNTDFNMTKEVKAINKEAHNETVNKILEQLREGFYKLLRVK